MIVAGFGFRHGVSADELLLVLEEAALAASLPVREVESVATAADRSAEPGLIAAAQRLSVPIVPVGEDDLRAADKQAATRSARALASYGVGSVCEAAALAAAGPGARLRHPRITGARSACALAEGPGR